MRNFLNLKLISDHVNNMREFARKYCDIETENDADKTSKFANLMDDWESVDTTNVYFQSQDDVMENQFLYLLHMRIGSGYFVVLKDGESYTPLPVFAKWQDLLTPHIKYGLFALARASNEDIFVQLVNWSPIDEPRLAFNVVFSFMEIIKFEAILGIKINTSDYKQVLDNLDHYITFLSEIELDALTVGSA